MSATTARSASVTSQGSTRPPTWIFERKSSARGTRLMPPSTLPSSRSTRLSPFTTAGTYSCTIASLARPSRVKSSTIARQFLSPVVSIITPAPPAPSSGFTTPLPPTSATNASSRSALDVTSVRGMCFEKCSV